MLLRKRLSKSLNCQPRLNGNSSSDSDSTGAGRGTDPGVSANEGDPIGPTRYPPSRGLNNKSDDAIRRISNELDLKREMAERLKKLQNFEIVLVLDDSGSMLTPVDRSQRTRWDELCEIVQKVLKIGVLFDSNGVDIHFLNRGSFLRVKDPQVVSRIFQKPPGGLTPLVPVLDKVFRSTLANIGRDKKLLVFVATDGVPTDENGDENIDALERTMLEIRKIETTYVSFLLCTDDQRCVDYLSEWDQTMRNVDVTDDFHTEREKVLRCARRGDQRFSQGDYVVKALIGAIDPDIDASNEPPQSTN